MIVKIQREKTPYEKYFLEAPGDPQQPNINIRSVVADKRLTQYADNIEEDEEPVDTEEMELVADDDGEDYAASIEEDEPDPELVNDEPEDMGEPEQDEDVPEEPETEDPNEDTPDAEIEDPDADDEGLETDDGTGEDFTDNIEDDTGDEAAEADTGEPTDGDNTSVANNTENQLKFSLYRKFRNLYDVIKNYQERIDSITTQSYNYNMALKSANTKLSSLENLIYDYMTLRFRDEPYITSMEFYQKSVITIKLIFEVIRTNKENQKPTNKTIN